MVYEAKIEPVQRHELIMGGVTLQLFVLFLNVLPWIHVSNDCRKAIFESDLQSNEDVSWIHDCISEHRNGILAGCSFLLLGFP